MAWNTQPGSNLAEQLPYISLEHIESNTGKILKEPTDILEDEGKSTTFSFDDRHILYGKLRPYLNKVALPEFSGRCTTELIPLLPHDDVSRDFLAFALRRAEIIQAAMRENTGSRMPRANMDELLREEIPLPPLPEQQRIAAILKEQLAAVEQARKASEARLEAARALSAAYLKEVFENKEAARLPRKRFGNVANLVRGRFSHRPRNDPRFYGGHYPWIQTSKVETSGKYITSYDSTLNDKGLAVSKLFPKGTLVMTIAATIGAVGILSFDTCMPDSLVAVIPNEQEAEAEYLYYLLTHIRKNMQSLAPRMAQANLKLELINPIEIPVPSLDIQGRVISYLNQKIDESNNIENLLFEEYLTINSFHSSILYKAFSGKL